MESKEGKEDGEVPTQKPGSPPIVLPQISAAEVKVVNESKSIRSKSGNRSPVRSTHRRSQSEVVAPTHRRSNSLQNIKSQIQKAWGWGGHAPEEPRPFSFNPEVLANQKREWYQLQAKTPDRTKYKEPNELFEHFLVTGLPHDANLEAVEDAFAKRKKWEMEKARADSIDIKYLQYRGPSTPSIEPQILFKYPHGKRLPMRSKDICGFLFPEGVKARVLERTPSLSDLNELIYGQEHLGRDDSSFIFSLKAADDATLFGVCLLVQEIVQRPPGILGGSTSPFSQTHLARSRLMVSAPRCYCLLSRVPFFELHYEMLNSIIAQERLNRITQFVSEMSVAESCLSNSRMPEKSCGNSGSPSRVWHNEWLSSAIPVERAVVISAAASGMIPVEEVEPCSVKHYEDPSPQSISASEASDFGASKELDQHAEKNLQHADDNASDVSDSRPNGFDRSYEHFENGIMFSPEFSTASQSSSQRLVRSNSSASLFSSLRSLESPDEFDEYFSYQESDYSCDFMTMEWAKEQKNEFLQIVCGYASLPVPLRGNEIIFQPLEHLQAVQYRRPSVSELGFDENVLELESQDPIRSAEVKAKLAAAEEAFALSVWTTATVCRVLRLDSVLALIVGVLLEKQVVITCPNLGVLSAVVLFLVNMIHPFQWQSLVLPVLPAKMLEFLDAPVPYLVGLHHRPSDYKFKSSNLVYIDVLRDQVKMCYLPLIPRRKELVSKLRPLHARLASQHSIAERHPVYKCNEEQAEAATQFRNVVWEYMESLCSDLRFHTITSVESDNDRVCVLMKDSYIDSFPNRDRPFIKLFVETQMFSVLSDSRLSQYESELRD